MDVVKEWTSWPEEQLLNPEVLASKYGLLCQKGRPVVSVNAAPVDDAADDKSGAKGKKKRKAKKAAAAAVAKKDEVCLWVCIALWCMSWILWFWVRV